MYNSLRHLYKLSLKFKIFELQDNIRILSTIPLHHCIVQTTILQDHLSSMLVTCNTCKMSEFLLQKNTKTNLLNHLWHLSEKKQDQKQANKNSNINTKNNKLINN